MDIKPTTIEYIRRTDYDAFNRTLFYLLQTEHAEDH